MLVHGMGRTSFSMRPMARALRRAGYEVLNWGYSSTRGGVAVLGRQLADAVRDRAAQFERIHFVGHSLGTVLIRWLLAHEPIPHAGRIVMLAPPNQGSRTADRMARWWGWLLKPLPELGTAATSTARSLAFPPAADIGIIAGELDGKVSVAETRLQDAAHVIVPATHTFLMRRRDVQRFTISFLQNGHFDK